jgi:hypothetical protein
LKNEYLLLCFENEYNFSTEILECWKWIFVII